MYSERSLAKDERLGKRVKDIVAGLETMGAVREKTDVIKGKKIQVHFDILEDQWREFRKKVVNRGYSTASEFLREKVREVLKESKP